jgi:hypothetical protein
VGNDRLTGAALPEALLEAEKIAIPSASATAVERLVQRLIRRTRYPSPIAINHILIES